MAVVEYFDSGWKICDPEVTSIVLTAYKSSPRGCINGNYSIRPYYLATLDVNYQFTSAPASDWTGYFRFGPPSAVLLKQKNMETNTERFLRILDPPSTLNFATCNPIDVPDGAEDVLNAVTLPISHMQCPITYAIMTDPVKCDDGHTYERKDIQKWLDDKGTSPMTFKSCAIISEDHDMRKTIEAYVQQVTKREGIIEDVKQVKEKRAKRA